MRVEGGEVKREGDQWWEMGGRKGDGGLKMCEVPDTQS